MISGDFTITQKVVITSDYDANLQVGQLCGNFLCLMFPYEASTEANWWIPSVILERKIYKGSPTGYNRLYATYQTESGAIADYISFTANTFWWQIVRSGSTITANCSSNGITYTPLKQFTDCATSPVVIQVISYTTDDGYDHEGYTDDLITSFTGTSTCYSNSLPKTAITDFALADNTSTAGTSTIALGYGYGAWIADTDESTPQSSECDGNVRGAYTTTTSSSVYDVLGGISNSVTAICLSDDAKAITSTAGAGELIVSTSDGMSVVDLTDDSLENYFTEDNEIGYGGILLDDDVNDIVWGSSVFIATNSGGMWATLNSDPPANGTTYVHNHNGDMVNISTDTPTEADYHHSELYRRAVVNGSGYQVLKNDGFGGLGAVVDFPWTATGKISYFDTTANDTDDQYIYKWIHKDNSGNASSGDPQSAYIDDPLVDTVSACDPDDFSTARTRTRAVVVNVSASSGSLTDVEDAVEWIKIKEGSGSSYDDVPYQRYESGKNYNFCLSSGTGVKTLWVRAYSQSYRYDATGASDKSCTIELV
ncbi:MAG TPA: hypothetical protein PKW95_20500, partial [bacterium]|nr:hypothetical protein [bacterium]